MNLQQKMTEDHRRSALWFLMYDTDYTLGNDMLMAAFEMAGKSITIDQLANVIGWLREQGFVTTDKRGNITFTTLTDRGLEIAQGKSRAAGIRDLRPSEIAEIKAR